MSRKSLISHDLPLDEYFYAEKKLNALNAVLNVFKRGCACQCG